MQEINVDDIVNLDIAFQKQQEYKYSNPFPNTVIDNFFKNEEILNLAIEEFKTYQFWGYDPTDYSKKHQVKKFFSPWNEENIYQMPENIKKIINFFNSQRFIEKLEKLTGINNLIADHSLAGGGMHRIDSGGRLSIHADYNRHPYKPLYRRINLLLYLNKNWNESWGGDLQLWNKEMTAMIKSISPLFNRVAIFNTTPTAYHGHPHPLNTPSEISRYSIAMYYFTSDCPIEEKSDATTAIWKDIPN